MQIKVYKISFKNFLLYSGISFLIIFLLSFSVMFALEKQLRKLKLEEIKTIEQSSVLWGGNFMGDGLSSVIADLNYLVKEYKNELDDGAGIEKIEANWADFSQMQGIYDQIRFIAFDGSEEIRINYKNGKSYIVEKELLQNKKYEYYFTDSVVLPQGSVYISRLDLNLEYATVETPFKPMIRVSSPVYTSNGSLLGVVVLNYLAEDLLESFRELAAHTNSELILLNEDGYWLSSPDRLQEWNFMFVHMEDETFGKYYPEEWNKVLEGSGQILTENGLFTYTSVDLVAKIKFSNNGYNETIVLGGGDWYIVSKILRDGVYEDYFTDNFILLVKDVFLDNILIFSLVLFVSIAMGLFAYLYIKSYEKTKYFAKYDALTNVYNRRTGTNMLDQILIGKDRKNFKISLCFIDVNGLKEVNDILGHRMGDELLKTVSDVIKKHIRENDFIARMGGDEFLLVFSRIVSNEAEIIWGRITSEFDRINTEEDRPYIISVSHGVVSCTGDTTCATTDKMIKAADEKMYEEKRVIKQSFYAIRKEDG